MSHAVEGQLLAYLDGELAGDAAVELRAHLDGCAACRGELDALRHETQVLTGALSLLDRPVSAEEATRAWWRVRAAAPASARRRFATGTLARAAGLLLAFAGVLSAAIPGSPVRRVVERLFEGSAATPAPSPATSPAPVEPAPLATPAELPGVTMLPADNGVRVLVWSAHAGATVSVNLVDGGRVSVQAGSDAEDVRFRTGRDRVEVLNLGGASAVIDLPRSLAFASVEVDGRQWLFKEGDQLHVTGPVVQQSAKTVVFRAGS